MGQASSTTDDDTTTTLEQLLAQLGINADQFKSDLLSASSNGSSGQSSVYSRSSGGLGQQQADLSQVLRTFKPGSVLNVLA